MSTLDGIINLDKPVDITSAKALYKVRKITGVRKSGHAGTLDPNASGVLILCLGKATKLVERLMDQPKVYRATARLDMTSASYDAEKETTPVEVAAPPSREALREALASFEGTIAQVPPAFSALKIKGRPAYELARKNRPIELEPRPVQIHWLHLHRYEYPEVEFEMCCGRGTYVRALIRDRGEKLNTGGCLTALIRTQVGPFHQSDGWSFDGLAEASSADDYLVDLDRCNALLSEDNLSIPPRPV